MYEDRKAKFVAKFPKVEIVEVTDVIFIIRHHTFPEVGFLLTWEGGSGRFRVWIAGAVCFCCATAYRDDALDRISIVCKEKKIEKLGVRCPDYLALRRPDVDPSMFPKLLSCDKMFEEMSYIETKRWVDALGRHEAGTLGFH